MGILEAILAIILFFIGLMVFLFILWAIFGNHDHF